MYMVAARGLTKFARAEPLHKLSRGYQSTAKSRTETFRENSYVGRAALGFGLCSLIASGRLVANKAQFQEEKEEFRVRLMTVIDTETEKREELLDKAIDAAKAAGLPAKARSAFAAELRKFNEQLKMTTGLAREADTPRNTPTGPSSKEGEVPAEKIKEDGGPKQVTVW